jgi:hypothetical protein
VTDLVNLVVLLGNLIIAIGGTAFFIAGFFVDVVPILSKQSTARRFFWCRECSHQFEMVTAVTMRPELITCPGCEVAGFVVGQAKR